jgi:hypothetical protein
MLTIAPAGTLGAPLSLGANQIKRRRVFTHVNHHRSLTPTISDPHLRFIVVMRPLALALTPNLRPLLAIADIIFAMEERKLEAIVASFNGDD